MDPSLEVFGRFASAEITETNGCVLVRVPGMNHSPTPRFRSPLERAIHENFENHEHFPFEVGSSIWERWQNNLILARTIQDLWSAKLRLRFPRRRFASFIWNELCLWRIDDRPGDFKAPFEIMPTLRLWSACNDPDGEMQESFHGAESRLDSLVWEEEGPPRFMPMCEVFTARRTVKRSFLRRIGQAIEKERSEMASWKE